MKRLRLSLGGTPLNLEATLNCGQVFHWTPKGKGYLGALGEEAVYFEHDPAKAVLEVMGTTAATARHYLGLEDDLEAIVDSFPSEDAHLHDALAFTPGLRICHQPPWECLATFITSSLKQVPHIRQISLTLRERYGNRYGCQGEPVYAYPTPERLAEAGETGLRACGLGYRAKGLALAASRVASGAFSLDLSNLDDEAARAHLCELHGVGEKIANCVLLFGYGRFAAFPIDVWVQRVMSHLYAPRGKKRKWPLKEMQAYARRYFGPHAGYAQQYLFHYARHHDKVLFGAS